MSKHIFVARNIGHLATIWDLFVPKYPFNRVYKKQMEAAFRVSRVVKVVTKNGKHVKTFQLGNKDTNDQPVTVVLKKVVMTKKRFQEC